MCISYGPHVLVTAIPMLVADVGDILDDGFEILVTDLTDNEKKSSFLWFFHEHLKNVIKALSPTPENCH